MHRLHGAGFPASGHATRRRAPPGRTLLTITLCAAAACSPPPPPLEPCRDCNVVLISVDTLRADHVGAYGYARPTTPNIDALAGRGIVFENAIAQSSWTRPAHMSIFTGLHPREHGFVALRDSRRLEPEVPTIASVLAKNGWATAGFSGGVNMAASFGFGQGFEVYRNNGKYFRDNFEDARYWLDHNQQRRFFLFFHGYDAHTPYHSDSIDRRAVGLTDPPPRRAMRRVCRKGKPTPKMDAYIDEYDAAVHRADRYVGKLIADLERRGLLSRTIIVVLSDHGEEFLEHGRCFHVSTLHREVLQVPLIVVAPGLAPRRVKTLVPASVTVAPTLMQLVGIEDAPFPGPSLVAAARGLGTRGESVVSETERGRDNGGDGHVRALTGEDFKFIRWGMLNRSELYRIPDDSAEHHPVDNSWRRTQLSRQLEGWAEAHPPRFEPRRRGKPGGGRHAQQEQREEDEALKRREEQLRSLGYAD